MRLADTAKRLGATALAMAGTRLELAALELEEESQRLLGYAVMALAALFLFGLAIALVALFIVILFWDSHRLAAVGVLAALFALGGVVLGAKVKSSIAAKPRLMAGTIGELRKDLELFGPRHGEWHE